MPWSEKWSDFSASISGLQTGSELQRVLAERRARPLPSAPPLDALEGGGLRRGSLIELCGPRSSGRFALVLSALAAATRAGEAAALIDTGDHLDPRGAAEAGVELARLLWTRPRTLPEALVCARAALDAGFALVVLDLGERAQERVPSASWLRLARAAEAAQAVLLLVSARPTAGSAAESLVEAERARSLWDLDGPPLLRGLSARLILRKRRGGSVGGNVPLSLPI
jgi:RecA/RadA recombinase